MNCLYLSLYVCDQCMNIAEIVSIRHCLSLSLERHRRWYHGQELYDVARVSGFQSFDSHLSQKQEHFLEISPCCCLLKGRNIISTKSIEECCRLSFLFKHIPCLLLHVMTPCVWIESKVSQFRGSRVLFASFSCCFL